MNRKYLSVCFSLILSGGIVHTVIAAGVPTVSVAELSQLVINAQQQAQQALAQLEKAKEAIQQAKGQYDHYKSIMQGNDKLGAFLNDPYVNKLLPTSDWEDIYSQAKNLPELRKRYGLTGYEPQAQAVFDKLLSQVGVLEDQYQATNTRIQHAEGLRRRLDSVETPKEREQLALRYQQERLELEVQQAQLQNTRYLQEEKRRLEKQKNAQNFLDYLDGKRNDLQPLTN
ncbi:MULTISPECIES: type IV secretion system protein [Pectobacterium]|uniref:type IV secretion system protein n=1 Tax=Pectobacterium TaxID=122277 RepID=UPI0004E60D50|nr:MULTISPECIES: type IV secretion system protein [Pectobacterium]KFF71711.1 conjugal transfer protein [Pectobacterium brasiliense]MBA5603718.1 conjugal transfer protein [Pectobacterium aroidearum]